MPQTDVNLSGEARVAGPGHRPCAWSRTLGVALGLCCQLSLWPGWSTVRAGEATLLFNESFENKRLRERGWYDGTRFTISKAEAFAGKGCLEYTWKRGGTTPANSSGTRHLFEATDTVALRCYLRLAKGWGWSGRAYDPHLMLFMTTEKGKFDGPAASHLTVYIEPWNGKLRLAAQDIQNRDQPHGLTQGPLLGGFNGVFHDSKDVLFKDDDWHCLEAMFQLNSLDAKTQKPKADGIMRGWVDGRLVIDRTNVVLRSADSPKMQFNEFRLAPYFGPGLLPHKQTLWIDELAVGRNRLGPIGAPK